MREIVRAGDHRIGQGEGEIAVQGLGSCVAIILWDPEVRVGGLAHVLLPDPSFSTTSDRRMRFATTAVPWLVEEMEQAGAARDRLHARLVGGASMFRDLLPSNRPNMGDRNVSAARSALDEEGIPIIAEDVGGEYGRTVRFDLAEGRIHIRTPRREDVIL